MPNIEDQMALGQIPMMAARAGFETLTDDTWFKGNGDLKVPFNMIDISDEPKFGYLPKNHRIFCSTIPLTDDCFWQFEVVSDNLRYENGGYWYLQFDDLTTQSGDYSFSYHKCVQPFSLDKLRLDINYLPQTRAEIQAVTGVVPGVMITPETRFFAYTDQNELKKTLSSDEITSILMNRRMP